MIIGSCRLDLYFPGSNSLKDKRHILKSLIQRTRAAFNVAIAEVEHHDDWRLATIAIVTVSNESSFSSQVIQGALRLIEKNPELELLEIQVEML